MKTAAELEMSQEEFDALLKVREMLVAGHIEHRDAYAGKLPTCGFDMNQTQDQYSCGTAMCIGGWVKTFLLGIKPDENGIYVLDRSQQIEIDHYVYSHDWDEEHDGSPLASLYYPRDIGRNWEDLTTAQAVQAIDNFLKTGDADWASVVE